jgi:hypothetical protein
MYKTVQSSWDYKKSVPVKNGWSIFKWSGPKWWVPSEIRPLKTGLVQSLDPHCIKKFENAKRYNDSQFALITVAENRYFYFFQMVSATPYNLLTAFSRIPEENIVDCVGNDDNDSYYGTKKFNCKF